jgi:hypothetical protein
MIAPVLREGFAQAHHRPGLIFLDLVWKLIWLALTLIALFSVTYSFISHIEWQPSNVRVINVWVFAGLLREAWANYGGEFLGGLFAVLCMSGVLWFFLEGRFRRRIVLDALVGAGFSPGSGSNRKFVLEPESGLKPAPTRTSQTLGLFIASNLAKLAILTAVAVLLARIWMRAHDVAIPALVAFGALAFFLTIIDTLIRTDAVDLLGVDLLGITGLIGTLVAFECLIGGALGIAMVIGFLKVSSLNGALIMIGVTTLVLFIFNFLHSYLLVVRFSAVGIMRRNVIEV